MPAQQSTDWDPGRYLRFEQQRTQPFRDLLARVRIDAESDPGFVVDLGCGPGNATALLARRWPQARVCGVDNSPQMIEAAAAREEPGRLEFRLGDLRELTAKQLGGHADVVITNATLQWVPGHLELLPRLAGLVAPGGSLALGVPGNLGAPSHTILAGIQQERHWRERLSGLQVRPAVAEPEDYLRALDRAGLSAQAWETTYLYVLDGRDGVFEFVSSTALRPVLAELGPGTPEAAEFCEEYRRALREAYPPTELEGRTVQILAFRRIFAIGERAAGRRGR